jgi:hypothetical protein
VKRENASNRQHSRGQPGTVERPFSAALSLTKTGALATEVSSCQRGPGKMTAPGSCFEIDQYRQSKEHDPARGRNLSREGRKAVVSPASFPTLNKAACPELVEGVTPKCGANQGSFCGWK